ncbi:MAG TPA: aminoglycoside phosphotransferase family protein [Candidatus Limnocylindria bacterium]|nr:aminoglycoside phosphotransferase family protein [Candidatus Limnocylindria bacterium]
MSLEYGPGWQWEPARKLERTAHEVALAWGLRLGPRYEWARFSFAAPAGDHAVLKLTPPEDDDADHEGDALAFWNGRGAVRLLKRDKLRRALLIERCVPGHDASSIDDHEAIRVALDTGRELWRPVAAGPFLRGGEFIAGRLRDLAADTDHPFVAIATELFAAMAPRADVLVHGDFHHHNLLRHTGRWLAIDPKPLIAEPEFDVVTLLWNPFHLVPTREITERRIAQLAAGGLDERRIRDWAIVRGTELGLPLGPDEDERSSRQLCVVRWLLEARGATAA